MKPKSEVFLMDCMDLMKSYPDKFFNLAIVDPPYTDDYANMKNWVQNMKGKSAKVGTYHYNTLENSKPNERYFDELFRVSKNQIIWGGNYFEMSVSRGWVVWDKLTEESNFADCELAWTSFDRSIKKFTFMWNGMLQGNMKNKEDRIHPTQKPVALYKWLLKNYAKEGDKILDTHLGSGSSRIAAFLMGFDFWGCEIDKDYFEAQEKRFKEQTAQQTLFGYDKESRA